MSIVIFSHGPVLKVYTFSFHTVKRLLHNSLQNCIEQCNPKIRVNQTIYNAISKEIKVSLLAIKMLEPLYASFVAFILIVCITFLTD